MTGSSQWLDDKPIESFVRRLGKGQRREIDFVVPTGKQFEIRHEPGLQLRGHPETGASSPPLETNLDFPRRESNCSIEGRPFHVPIILFPAEFSPCLQM